MADKEWKARIRANQEVSLAGRGIVMAKDDKENKVKLEEVSQRGGIVFVSEEAKQALEGGLDAVNP